jgi:hypothetical protein
LGCGSGVPHFKINYEQWSLKLCMNYIFSAVKR